MNHFPDIGADGRRVHHILGMAPGRLLLYNEKKPEGEG